MKQPYVVIRHVMGVENCPLLIFLHLSVLSVLQCEWTLESLMNFTGIQDLLVLSACFDSAFSYFWPVLGTDSTVSRLLKSIQIQKFDHLTCTKSVA